MEGLTVFADLLNDPKFLGICRNLLDFKGLR